MFCFSVITLTYLLHTHTQGCFVQDRFTDMQQCDFQNGRETFICVDQLGEKYKRPALLRDPHFPLVSKQLRDNMWMFTYNYMMAIL